MRKLLALTAAVAVAAAIVGSALASHSWGSYHWSRTSNPLTLTVGDNVTQNWETHLNNAVVEWSKSSVLDLTGANGATSPSSCSPVAGRIEACNDAYGNTGWLGIAQIWVSGGHITQATTKVNDTYFDTATYNTPAWRQFVMCQEIGHDFGLDHQDENNSNANLGSCMDYTNDPDGGAGGASSNDPSNEKPNQHDYDQLATIYTHLDGSGGGSTCPGKSKKRCSSANDDAPPFAQASRANGSVYVDHLPNGGRLLTHVFWTPFGE